MRRSRGGRSAPVSTPAQAQADLDRWCSTVSNRRRRGQRTVSELAATEPLLGLPELPFPASYREQRVVSREALIEFETNRYSMPPGYAGETVEVRARLGELHLDINLQPVGESLGIAARCPAPGRRSAPKSTQRCSSRRCSTSSRPGSGVRASQRAALPGRSATSKTCSATTTTPASPSPACENWPTTPHPCQLGRRMLGGLQLAHAADCRARFPDAYKAAMAKKHWTWTP